MNAARVLSVLGLLVAAVCAVLLLTRQWQGEVDGIERARPGAIAAEDANLRELWAHASVDDSWCEIALRAHAYCWGYLDWEEFKDLVSRHPRAHRDKDWQQALLSAVVVHVGRIDSDTTYHGPHCRHYQARRVWELRKDSLGRCPKGTGSRE